MAQADRIFKKAFREHFSNHEANFPPSRNVELGAYGSFANGYFTREGNIKDSFEIDFKTLADPASTAEEFQSSGNVSINSVVKGQVTNGTVAAKAAIEFSFSAESALYFSSAAVKYQQIDNLGEVGKKILAAYRKGAWKKGFVVVTRLITGINALIIISGSSSSTLKLEASSPQVERLNLADATAKFDIVSSNKVNYKSVADGESPIGMGLSKLYNPLFHRPDFGPLNSNSRRFRQLDVDSSIDEGNLAFGDILGVHY